MTHWTPARKADVARRWDAGEKPAQIARALGVSRASIIGLSRRLNLHFESGARAIVLSKSHPAAVRGRSIFSHKRQDATAILKPGSYSRKTGGTVTKGAWKGMPIYTLTLEERATCPRSCENWLSCYGNNMPWARRYMPGEKTEALIEYGLRDLQALYPMGFVVRLHILGDFYSVTYAFRWRQWLKDFPALRIFGYTAWQSDTPIGQVIDGMRRENWSRFAIRTSGAKHGPRAVTIENEAKAKNAVVCPAQTGRTNCCGTCALCWSPAMRDIPIAFLQH